MSIANFPASLNLAQTKASAIAECNSSFQRIKSDTTQYSPGEMTTIEIPCGRVGDFLHGADSFLEFKFKPTFTATTGNLLLNGNAYSFIRRLTVRHSSNQLIDIDNFNRYCHAIYDVQADAAERVSGGINLGIINTTATVSGVNLREVASADNCMNGIQLASGQTYSVAFTLPCALIGSLQEKATPLGWMASSLYIDIIWEDYNKICTTRVPTSVSGAIGSVTVLALTQMIISDVYYNAKISQIAPMYNQALLQSFVGSPIRIPAVDWKCEYKTIAAATTAINEKLAFQFSSAKIFLWWLTNQQTANGVITSNNLNHALTQRQAGRLKDYCLSFNGNQIPSQAISTSSYGPNPSVNKIFGAVSYSNVMRAFNLNSSSSAGGVISDLLYTNSIDTYATDSSDSKRFIGAVDLDRFCNSQDKFLTGFNCLNQQCNVVLNWDTALAEAQMLYCFMQYDVSYELKDGLLYVNK